MEGALAAGAFSAWLRQIRGVLGGTADGAHVPCGACTVCCRSSMFIHVGPEETASLARIPRRLVFPAPGLPKGYVVMGYDDEGRCPMFAGEGCTIYEDRPRTCRDYDCRVFAATGLSPDPLAQRGIAEQVARWRFDLPTQRDRDDLRAVQAAGAFLSTHRDLFPDGVVPHGPTPFALLAIRTCGVFSKLQKRAAAREPPWDSQVVQRVLEEMSKARASADG